MLRAASPLPAPFSMTRRVLFFATLLPLVSLLAAYGDEPRLLGTWKANRKATEWYLTTELNLKPDVAETLSKLSGQRDDCLYSDQGDLSRRRFRRHLRLRDRAKFAAMNWKFSISRRAACAVR